MRYWTVEEARAYLPRLRTLLGVIRRAAHLAVAARGNGHALMPGAPPAEGSTAGEDTAGSTSSPGSPASAGPAGLSSVEPSAEAPPAVDVEQAMAELEENSIVLRDADRGLIDFPARHPEGRDVLLCWQLGEDDLAWWHLPEDGFPGRRPLPLPPEI